MATIKGLTGNPTIAAGGASLQIINYGVPSVSSAFTNRDTGVIGSGVGTVSNVQPPAFGKAVARSDGRISVNLNDTDASGDLDITYDLTVGGNTTTVTDTISVAAGIVRGGWDKPDYYLPEINGQTNAVIWEPDEGCIYIYCRPDGPTTIALVASERGIAATSGAVTGWLNSNPGHGYGINDATAFDQELAQLYAKTLNTPYRQFCLLFKAGETYQDATTWGNANGAFERAGPSMLHPIYVGAYGDLGLGLPYFQGVPIKINAGSGNIIVQNIGWGGSNPATGRKAICFDNIYLDLAHATATTGPLVMGPGNIHTLWRSSFRRIKFNDMFAGSPTGGAASWDNDDRYSIFGANVNSLLYECVTTIQSGWSEGYRLDGLYSDGQGGFWPKPGEDRSHGTYLQSNNAGATIRDILMLQPCFSVMQIRPGGIVTDVFGFEANQGLVIGRGPGLDVDEVNSFHSYVDGVVRIGAGNKHVDNGTVVVGRGNSYSGLNVAVHRNALINAGTPVIKSDLTDTGPALIQGKVAYYDVNDYSDHTNQPGLLGYQSPDSMTYVYGWADQDDENVAGISGLDDVLVEKWLDQHLSVTGSTRQDFLDYMIAHPSPWDLVRSINDFAFAPLNIDRPIRTTPATCVFRPHPAKRTPGIRADVALDWTTQDLPGAVAGDAIDLGGHDVHWNQTPANAIAGFSFGDGGRLTMHGGALRPTSVNVGTGGNDLHMNGGAKFDLPGYAGSDRLTVTMDEARLINTGTVAGKVDVTARSLSKLILGYDNAAWTIASGDVVEVLGHAVAGWDGAASGTSSLTIAGQLTFASALRMELTGLVQGNFAVGASGPDPTFVNDFIVPRIGATITGQTSGATAIVTEAISAALISNANQSDWQLILRPLSGVFVAGEQLHADDLHCRHTISAPAGVFGSVRTAPSYVLGQLRKVATGIDGRIVPSVTANVTLGGTLHLDITGVSNGTYDLISADTITGAFGAVTATGNAAKDIAIAVSGTGVSITVAAGTGLIT